MLLCSLVNAAGWTTRKKSIEFSVVFSHCASFLGQIPRFREKCLSMFRNEKNFNQLQNSVPKQEGTCKLGLSFSCLWISDVLLQPNTGERSVKKTPANVRGCFGPSRRGMRQLVQPVPVQQFWAQA